MNNLPRLPWQQRTTNLPATDEDDTFVIAYTGHERTYEELIATANAPSAALPSTQSMTTMPTRLVSDPVMDGPFANGPLSGPLPSPLEAWFAPPSPTPSTDIAMPATSVAPSNTAAPSIDIPAAQHDNRNVNQPATTTSVESPAPSTDDNASMPANNTSNSGNNLRKSCARCHSRKLKCIIIGGTEPKICTECQQKGLACVFEAKKPYTRKSAAGAN